VRDEPLGDLLGDRGLLLVPAELDGVLEPVEHVRGAPDNERVIRGKALDRRGRSRLGIDPGRLQRLGDPFGYPPRGTVAPPADCRGEVTENGLDGPYESRLVIEILSGPGGFVRSVRFETGPVHAFTL
jgi:hypothetical protein